jgi:hypothetical protein
MKKEIQKKAIVVLGTQRSGTSVVSGILSKLGVDLGNFRPSDETNPYGYFEDIEFSKLIKEVFDDLGRDGNNPPEYEEIIENRQKFESKIRKLCEEKSRGKDNWGWKVPGTNSVIELFLPHLINPHFVIVFRNPLQVADSIVKRAKLRGDEEINQLKALKLVATYNEQITNFLERHQDFPKIFVSYEILIKDPISESRKLSAFLGIDFTKQRENEIRKLVVPRWRVALKRNLIIIKKFISTNIPTPTKNSLKF